MSMVKLNNYAKSSVEYIYIYIYTYICTRLAFNTLKSFLIVILLHNMMNSLIFVTNNVYIDITDAVYQSFGLFSFFK